jgi:adenylosuccinate synthase
VKHAVATSGVDALALTKLDVLTGLDPLRVCVAYELDGKRRDTVPATIRAWERIRPIYEELPGWRENLTGARALGDLPPNAQRYVERLVALVGAPLALLSIGPQRDETIRLGDIF